MIDKSVLVAVILGAVITMWTASKTWGKGKNKLTFQLDKIYMNINDVTSAALEELHKQGKKVELKNTANSQPMFIINDTMYKMSYSTRSFGKTVQTITFIPYEEFL